MAASGPAPEITARIVAGARRHFFPHGFRGVTMSDLAAELGISKKTFYVHFANKEALVAAVIETKFAEMAAELEDIHATSAGFGPDLHRLLTTLQSHAKEIGPSFARDLRRDAPELFSRIQARRQELIRRVFGRLLEKGRKEGAVRRDIPVDFLIEVLLGAVQSTVTPDKVVETGLGPGKLIERILAIFLEGVLTEKGRRSR